MSEENGDVPLSYGCTSTPNDSSCQVGEEDPRARRRVPRARDAYRLDVLVK